MRKESFIYPKFVKVLKFLMTLLIVKLYFSNHPKCQAYSAACIKWSFREIETEEMHATRKKSASGSHSTGNCLKNFVLLGQQRKKKNELIKLKLNPLFIIQY